MATTSTKYQVKWPITGFPGGDLAAGDTIEVPLETVKAYVAKRWGGDAASEDHAALIPVSGLAEMKTEGRVCASCGAFDSLVTHEKV